MTAKQSQSCTQLQPAASPVWSTCPCQQRSNGDKIWRVKHNLHLTCKGKNCCPSPRLLVWHFPILAGDILAPLIPFLPTTDLNQILHSDLTHTLKHLLKTMQLQWYNCYLQIRLGLFYKTGKITEYFVLLYHFHESREISPAGKLPSVTQCIFKYGTAILGAQAQTQVILTSVRDAGFKTAFQWE